MPALDASLLADPVVGLGLLALVGVVAGLLNTMAGGGSFLAIPLLIALGLPAGVANGTIRVGVVLQSAVAAITFHRRGVREHAATLRWLAPMAVGALAGSFLAARLDDAILRPVFGVAFVLWAILLAVRPGKFTQPPSSLRPRDPLGVLLALLIGVYGGFLQAGVGFPLIAFLVLYVGYDPVRANAIKVLAVGLYTLVALPVFAFAGRVAWVEGGVLALGTMLGAWLGARWQLESGAGVVRWFVLVTVAVSGLSMLL